MTAQDAYMNRWRTNDLRVLRTPAGQTQTVAYRSGVLKLLYSLELRITPVLLPASSMDGRAIRSHCFARPDSLLRRSGHI